MGEVNPYKDLPRYRYSQPTFKSFTDEEVRTEAGKEVLPGGDTELESTQEGVEPQLGDGEETGDPQPEDRRSMSDEVPSQEFGPGAGGNLERSQTREGDGGPSQRPPLRRESSSAAGDRRTTSLPRQRSTRPNTPRISAKSARKQREKAQPQHRPIDTFFGPPTSAQPQRRYDSEASQAEDEERNAPSRRTAVTSATTAQRSEGLKRQRSDSVSVWQGEPDGCSVDLKLRKRVSQGQTPNLMSVRAEAAWTVARALVASSYRPLRKSTGRIWSRTSLGSLPSALSYLRRTHGPGESCRK